MTEVLHFPASPSGASPSSSSSSSASSASSSSSPTPTSLSYASRSNAAAAVPLLIGSDHRRRNPVPGFADDVDFQGSSLTGLDAEDAEQRQQLRRSTGGDGGDQLSLLALLVAIFRRSLVSCKSNRREFCSMEIGWPTNVRHVAHVTFDRFNGFLGLPDEFEPEVPRRAPSASATAFGVSTESMQLSYDSRGNCVPTILLLMQNCLYTQGGLQAEGIFRITAENSEEEAVREQLNRGVIPEGVDIHCLAGLIKAWFRELPSGVLDPLSPEQVMQCQTEEEFVELVRVLPPTEASLLDWAINLMADVVQHEHLNKMNSRNIAMVFAPNMTQMVDPLTALMYVVQVMNFLKTLIGRTLRERQDPVVDLNPGFRLEPSDESGHESPSQSLTFNVEEKEDTREQTEGNQEGYYYIHEKNHYTERAEISDEEDAVYDESPLDSENDGGKGEIGELSESGLVNNGRKTTIVMPYLPVQFEVDKMKGLSNLSRVNSRVERIEAWR
ncbi:PREDICTED: rho GTPase-activating protein 1 [Tarenaya hassleriana]|uniref:rho GTPase-activating protein 1 n=1 Tax=Tarenaya hassleriana TaxID=28532 RepID=UPI00053C754A|nr:PREDICTED: rho GTPase-activating protein 1 [Tarenaya hassleriana]